MKMPADEERTEINLAHKLGNATSQAYQRGDPPDRRLVSMRAKDGLSVAGPVVMIRRGDNMNYAVACGAE